MFFRRYPSRLSFLAILLVTYVPATTESKKHVAHVWNQSVEVDLDNSVSLEVTGTNKAGNDAERSMKLPRDFFVESEYFSTYGRSGRRSARPWEIQRILYKFNGMTYIAGYYRPRFENTADSRGELTNVTWGFDVKTQAFWYEADPARLPPLPFEFRSGNWQGIRFRIPLDLERFRLEEAQAIIRARSGIVAGPGRPADVVLLPDDVDFIWARHLEAEKLIRGGAYVLWERNFPRPPGSPAD